MVGRRYIHLNSQRAKVAADMDALNRTGHIHLSAGFVLSAHGFHLVR